MSSLTSGKLENVTLHRTIMQVLVIFLSIIVNLSVCRDFYIGMFKRNDFLVAQDRLYKEKKYYSVVTAKYGRVFKCPITYFRVVDRLGVGRGPKVDIIRGGLLKNYIVLRLMSVYNYPISVNIYVGCENKMATVQTTLTSTLKTEETDRMGSDANVNMSSVTSTLKTDTSSTDASKDDKTVSGNSTISNGTVGNSTVGNNTM